MSTTQSNQKKIERSILQVPEVSQSRPSIEIQRCMQVRSQNWKGKYRHCMSTRLGITMMLKGIYLIQPHFSPRLVIFKQQHTNATTIIIQLMLFKIS